VVCSRWGRTPALPPCRLLSPSSDFWSLLVPPCGFRHRNVSYREVVFCARQPTADPPWQGDLLRMLHPAYCRLPVAFRLPVRGICSFAACLLPLPYQLSSPGQIFVAWATGNMRRAASAAR
jgi:hypothetical protein